MAKSLRLQIGGIYTVAELPCIVGRGGAEFRPDVDLGPFDGSGSVMRRHARLWAAADGVWLQDLGTGEATRVNGTPVTTLRLDGPRMVSFGSVDVLIAPG